MVTLALVKSYFQENMNAHPTKDAAVVKTIKVHTILKPEYFNRIFF